MKAWKQISLMTFVAFFEIILSLTACNNSESITPTHNHQWSDWTQTITPTCTTEGEKTRVCNLDATHKETYTIPALGHDWYWTITTPVNETEYGVETKICRRDRSHIGGTRSFYPCTTIAELKNWIWTHQGNTADTAYKVKMNLNYIGDSSKSGSLGDALKIGSPLNTTYVNLDLSDSTITSMGYEAFVGCNGLTSITIPDSVTKIGDEAFIDCVRLTSITFERSDIAIHKRFTYNSRVYKGSFDGDLCDKYLAEGKGTYTRALATAIWTKQP